MSNFDWSDKYSIVVEPRLGVAVFLDHINEGRRIVIRQEGEDGDDIVTLEIGDAILVAKRILQIVAEASHD